ncbi:TonB family protein [Trinickia sp. EG282A]|uniref:TonB family protein n=1 Tax=Trinickia sp. EG282A TaxID=3237013 RepID=UPI0034D3547D
MSTLESSALLWPLPPSAYAPARPEPSPWRDRRGLLASVALHAAAVAALVAWSSYVPKSAPSEKVVTLVLERPAPQPLKIVPPKVEPLKEVPHAQPEPVHRSVPRVVPQPLRSAPAPQPRMVAAPAETAQIGDAPPAQSATPAPVAAPSAPPASRVIGQEGIPSDYVNQVFQRINSSAAAHYPRIARFNHLEGRVGYRLTLAPDGSLLHCELHSSGDATLDAAANDAIRAAAPFPRLPDLGGSSYVLQGAIVYQAD